MSEQEEVERFRQLERLFTVKDRVRRSGIPERFRTQGLSDYHPVAETGGALAVCTGYASWFWHHWREGKGLALVGAAGTHKTTLACLTALDLSRIGFAVRYTRLDGYVEDLKSRIDLERLLAVEDEKAQALADLAASRQREWELRHGAYLVVLDDVGKEYRGASGFAAAKFESLLRQRYDDGLPTILTSNVAMEDWAAEYSPALRSFIHEACTVIVFAGFDARGRRTVSAGG